jgi:1,4-dihydroxy-2-naphthoate octaprenyltransferase
MVDGYIFEKCQIYAILCVNAFILSSHVLVAWLCLICGWIANFYHMGPKAHLPS